jgi:D-glycero-D-manno-heptose 1,7-bisphosphate phosphatase
LKRRRGVFLDRDGTIIEDVPYLGDPKGVKLIAGSADAIKMLNERGIAVVVITNQSGIARKLFSRNDLEQVHERMIQLIEEAGGRLDGVFYCPHHPEFDVECECRKPKPGLILMAAERLKLDLSRSYTIGDNPTDVLCGMNAGTKTVLIRGAQNDPERLQTGEISAADLKPDRVAGNLLEAVEWLLRDEG